MIMSNEKSLSPHNHNGLYSQNSRILTTNIIIPAYDISGNGLTIELKICAIPRNSLEIDSNGLVAVALEKNFRRIISIMSSINTLWECLKYYKYILECTSNFKVNDARSSSFALSLALLNIYREINNDPQIRNITGTGVLRIDGSFEETYLEQQKYFAVKNIGMVEDFLTSSKCNHLFELEQLLNQY